MVNVSISISRLNCFIIPYFINILVMKIYIREKSLKYMKNNSKEDILIVRNKFHSQKHKEEIIRIS